MIKKPAIKYILLPVLVIVAIATSIYLVIHSPKYTLWKIQGSLKNHDWEGFSKFVDVDAFYTSFVDQATSDNRNPIGNGIAQAVAGALKETAIAKIKQEVENPNNNISEGGVLASFFHDDSVKPKTQIIHSGKIASVRIYSKYGRLNVPAYIDIRMRSELFRYVVIGISQENIKHRTSVVDSALKLYYTIPAQKVKFIAIKKGCANSFYGSCFEDLILIEREVANKTSNDIASFEYEICPKYTSDDDGCRYTVDENIKAGKSQIFGTTIGWKYNQFISSQTKILKTPLSDVEAKPKKITFSNGKTIEVDDIAYITSEKQPSLAELGKFMKDNDLQWSDSVLAWSKE